MNKEAKEWLENAKRHLIDPNNSKPSFIANTDREKAMGYIDHALAKLKEQPLASDFTKECRELRKKGATDNQLEYAEKMMEACDRLDTEIKKNCETERYPISSMSAMRKEINQLEADLETKDELLFAYESVRAPKQPPASEFTKKIRTRWLAEALHQDSTLDYAICAILDLCDRLDRSESSRKELEQRLKAHSAGEAVKHFCRECRKPFWNVDDEPIICPHCGSKEMPVHDIDAEQIA